MRTSPSIYRGNKYEFSGWIVRCNGRFRKIISSFLNSINGKIFTFDQFGHYRDFFNACEFYWWWCRREVQLDNNKYVIGKNQMSFDCVMCLKKVWIEWLSPRSLSIAILTRFFQLCRVQKYIRIVRRHSNLIDIYQLKYIDIYQWN